MSVEADLVKANELFEVYRPFRNKLARFNVIDSLYLIWGYSRNYFFDKAFPNNIDKPFKFNPNEPDKFLRKYNGGLFDHELEFLEKEIILNCDIAPTQYTFRDLKQFTQTLNQLRGPIENTLTKMYVNQDNILLEFNRLAHRQFKWQLSYDRETIFRYYQIYSEPALADIIQKRFNLTTQQLFLIGFIFFTWSANHFKIALPMNSEVKALTNEMFEIFLGHFSTTIQKARHELKQFQQINENLYYTYNPLLAKPILIENSDAICPIPLFIYWQITSGIYYFINNEPNFDNTYGNSFQNYAGEVLKRSCSNPKLIIYPEEKYGKPEKGTADWILVDSDSIMLIECKTKRMRLDSKTELEIKNNLEQDLRKMAGFIGQLYKTFIDYQNNLYPSLKFDANKNFYPLVLTLEDWFININFILLGELNKFVLEYFEANNLDKNLVEKYPYHIRCASGFESDIQLINHLGIREYFHKADNNLIQDFIATFKFVNIYEGEFQKVFIDPIAAQQ